MFMEKYLYVLQTLRSSAFKFNHNKKYYNLHTEIYNHDEIKKL